MSISQWIGKSLGGRYEIEEILGQGGMSAVFRANDPNLKRIVAVKLIHSHLSSNPAFVSRFEEEAAVVAQLRHPNIVQVFDYNHDGDTYYMVLEFIPGETLQERLKRVNKSGRKMPLEETLRFTAQICEAVNYAHKRGLIHRDIKPANIMLDIQGQAILMDFGIVKMLGGQKHTATGAVVGTAMYMSPEQIKGVNIDERSDIYSIGVTLFEMLSGRPPFEADSVMTLMMMHLNDPLPDLHELRPDIPENIIRIIGKALAKEPGDRYASAAVLGADLKEALSVLAGGQTGTEDLTLGKGTKVDNFATLLDPQPGSRPVRPESSGTPPPGMMKPGPVTGQQGQASMGRDPRASENTFLEPGQGGAGGRNVPPGGYNPGASQAGNLGGSGSGTKRGMKLAVVFGIAGLFLLLSIFVGGGVLIMLLGPGNGVNLPGVFARTTSEPSPTIELVVSTETDQPTLTHTATATATNTPRPTQTLRPSATPTLAPPSATPTPTIPAGIPFVRINNISLDSSNRYVVEYETFEYTEQLPGRHVHFYFDTVHHDQAGLPGSGPWILYGGPRPFTGYTLHDRPAAASKMCALVANPDHSVQPNSGTCFDLPSN
jgi:serine/threonine protein kinase